MAVAPLEKRADRAKPKLQSSTPGAVREPVVAVSDIQSMISGTLGTSVFEIEELLAHLEKVRDRLGQEAERVQRDGSEYAQMNHEVHDIIKIIGESLSEWRIRQ
jgi:hypothetical protein